MGDPRPGMEEVVSRAEQHVVKLERVITGLALNPVPALAAPANNRLKLAARGRPVAEW